MANFNVVPIIGSLETAATLRRLADRIDAGEFEGKTCTLILDAHVVCHFGINIDDSRSAEAVCFDCNYAIAFMMKAALGGFE